MERYNGPQIPRPLPGAREVSEGKVSTERNREGKIWSKEISKESGHRCAPGLLLGRALWSVWLTGQNKPCNRAWAILENTVPADSYGEAALKTLKLPLYSLFSQQKGDLHQSRDKHFMPFEVLYGNKTVGGYQPSNSPAWDALPPEPPLQPPKHRSWLWVRWGGRGIPSWAPSVLSLPPALASGQQGRTWAVCSVNTSAARAHRFPFP